MSNHTKKELADQISELQTELMREKKLRQLTQEVNEDKIRLIAITQNALEAEQTLTAHYRQVFSITPEEATTLATAMSILQRLQNISIKT